MQSVCTKPRYRTPRPTTIYNHFKGKAYSLQARLRLELLDGLAVPKLLAVHLEPLPLRVRAVIVARPRLADGQHLLVDLVGDEVERLFAAVLFPAQSA